MNDEIFLELVENTGFICDTKLYKVVYKTNKIDTFIATSEGTRSICNDICVAGVDYTRKLQATCVDVFKILGKCFSEQEAVVVNLLRGSLNFGLRDALYDAFGWNTHTTCFLSAQRAVEENDSSAWHITESDYKKIYFPPKASFIFGDVVATGTSLKYGLDELLAAAYEQKIDVHNIVFFTYGGPKAQELLEKIDEKCREMFPNYNRTILIYLEGIFTVPTESTQLTIRLPGTDLLRYKSFMAPEFIESQYEDPAYPIERCTIYDAGSRAFWLYEYVEDVIGYWKQNLELSKHGMTYEKLLNERFPELDSTRFGKVDLKELSIRQITKMERLINGR